MEFKTTVIDLITNRRVTPNELPAFCEEAKQMAPSKVGQRICEEVSAVVNAQQMQTISWSQILVDVGAPAFIDKLIFHESGQVVRLDRREILFNDLHLVRKVSQIDLESKYPDFSFWKV